MPPGDTPASAASDAVAAAEPPRAGWRKARRSGSENGGCVEIAAAVGGLTAIRDSVRPHDGAHVLSAAAFAAFLADAKAGAYDVKQHDRNPSPAAEPDDPGSRRRGRPQAGDAGTSSRLHERLSV